MIGVVVASDTILAFVPGLLVIGLGLGVMLTLSLNVAQSAFPEDLQGEISGLSRSVSNLGSSLGIAIAGSAGHPTRHGCVDVVHRLGSRGVVVQHRDPPARLGQGAEDPPPGVRLHPHRGQFHRRIRSRHRRQETWRPPLMS